MITGAAPQVLEVVTPGGPARVHVLRPRTAYGVAVLGHGAGGGLRSVDLTAAVDALDSAGWATALVEQPWLVAGRRIAGPPATLDAAWVPVVRALRAPDGVLGRVAGPLLLAGRSAGARVACRTAEALGAVGVLCLSFPLHPPGRPDRLRAEELALVLDAGRPLLVVQGERDPFGTPDEVRVFVPPERVLPVAGTHTVGRAAAAAVREAVTAFADALRSARGPAPRAAEEHPGSD